MPSERDETSHHARRAVAGDMESLGWLVSHLAPLLLAQARYRLNRHPPGFYDPEDLVGDTWSIAIPRLGRIRPVEDRLTPVLVKYLGSILYNRYQNILQRRLSRPDVKPLPQEQDEGAPLAMDEDVSAVVQRAARSEETRRVLAAIEALNPADQAVVVLRAIEQRSNHEAAEILEIPPNTAAVRYGRARKRLQSALDRSVFDEIEPS